MGESRSDLLMWLNSLLQLNLTKIEWVEDVDTYIYIYVHMLRPAPDDVVDPSGPDPPTARSSTPSTVRCTQRACRSGT